MQDILQQILATSRANQGRTDNVGAVGYELRALLQELQAEAPRLTERQKAELVSGPWQQLWSNLPMDGGPPSDPALVYQVVRRGSYWNLSQYPGAVGGLRGAYAAIPDGFAVRFTRSVVVPGRTLRGIGAVELVQLAEDLERGALQAQTVPGPIGVGGKLTTLYVDEGVRIAGGEQTPVFDDDGVVQVRGRTGLLFVLVRPGA